ncbi:hypothetical protein C5167_038809 [Papaver somniferum]|uniref:Senescence regulator n=1 Tax=Papaver somniferum TaxID=3469 RepID=A0A4Y7IEL7_PAPSO|nr:uncharacterized protein LOC113332642 [Papaver somniferum]RZC45859.1 hypothetical protein C5167_038809 [Papaver somniferum]
MEEFQESDMIWSSSNAHHHRDNHFYYYNSFTTTGDDYENNQEESGGLSPHEQHSWVCQDTTNTSKTNNKLKKNKKMTISSSVPISIPASMSRRSSYAADSDYEDSDTDEQEKIVPPHVMVDRRINAENTAFSVCSGTGRTLKGRDLSKVRNSILRMTGFLES